MHAHAQAALKERLVDTDGPLEPLLDALKLLQELCGIAKSLQLFHRAAFYRKVAEHQYLAPLAALLNRPEAALRLAAIDVLLSSTGHDPSLLRSHVLAQKEGDGEMLHALLKVHSVGRLERRGDPRLRPRLRCPSLAFSARLAYLLCPSHRCSRRTIRAARSRR